MSKQIFSLRVWISGKVQGVGYRFWTVHQAKTLGLKGWVRNLPDGRVEAVLVGDVQTVNKMVHLCHHGPSAAVVREVITEPTDEVNFENFDLRS